MLSNLKYFCPSSGVKSVDKREGGGSHNWGTYEDEIKADEDKANTSTDEVLNEAPTAAGDATGEAMQTESGGEDSKEPEEPKLLTLDEYKKQLGERSGPKFNLRKAGEGSEIDPKWKKTYAYKKEKETHDEEEDEVSILFAFSILIYINGDMLSNETYIAGD
jgi:plasminogen activator inhibitor 1 RNA-binding protein